MTGRDPHPDPSPTPCPGFEEACTLAAWGEPVPTAAQEHLDGCDRCRAALAAAGSLARASVRWAGTPPERVRRDLAPAVFAATTRLAAEPTRRPLAWAGAAGGLAIAGLAALTWWRGRAPEEGPIPDFAAVDLDLLEDLDLAENLDLLELLDALEEMDDA